MEDTTKLSETWVRRFIQGENPAHLSESERKLLILETIQASPEYSTTWKDCRIEDDGDGDYSVNFRYETKESDEFSICIQVSDYAVNISLLPWILFNPEIWKKTTSFVFLNEANRLISDRCKMVVVDWEKLYVGSGKSCDIRMSEIDTVDALSTKIEISKAVAFLIREAEYGIKIIMNALKADN